MNLSPVLAGPVEVIGNILTYVELDEFVPLITRDEFGALKALCGYAQRDGIFGLIATVIHRIWNAVKAIFGQSDWQLAEKTIKTLIDRVLPYGSAFGISVITVLQLTIQKDTPEFQKKLNGLMQDFVEQISKINKEIKPLEKSVPALIDPLLNMFDISVIVSRMSDIPAIFARLHGIYKTLPLDEKLCKKVFNIIQKEGIIRNTVNFHDLTPILNVFYPKREN